MKHAMQGIPPMDAVERLNRFKEESKIRERKHELYSGEEGLGGASATALCTRLVIFWRKRSEYAPETVLSNQFVFTPREVVHYAAYWKQKQKLITSDRFLR